MADRIILYTGKGGVGKTSVAAATALRCAELGHRTVVISTDAAHSLADCFDAPLGPEPTEVAANLWGQECDIYYNLERHWGVVQEWVQSLLRWQGVDSLISEEIAVFPGMEELANLLWINQHHEQGRFDVIVVDCAPTAETFRLLSFPEVGRWWLDKLLPIERTMAMIARPVIRAISSMPVPEREVFDAIDQLVGYFERLQKLLSDVNLSSVRIVLNLEKMVIKEAQRNFTYLSLYEHVTDAIVVNRMIPADSADPFMRKWRELQGTHMKTVQDFFAPVPILTAPMFGDEVVGVEMLSQMAGELYGERDPSDFFYQDRPLRIEETPEGWDLIVPAPYVEKERIALVRTGDELVVRMGAARRHIVLPRPLVRLRHTGAKLEESSLRIHFVAD